MKRLVLLAAAFCALAIVVPVAQTAPTSAGGCPVEHLSGAECQGPDADEDANSCVINTWVGNASCELTVTDGVANAGNASAVAYAALDGANWHAEFDYVIRDKSTGQVLFSRDGSTTIPVAEAGLVPNANFDFGGAFSQSGGGEVVCEVTGTHSAAGAATSGSAATGGSSQFNNFFWCRVV
jgi:hypothetical protein